MMQVAAADEYDDYVICRGFDPRILKFIDYESGNAAKPGISVAKPYGNRTAGTYTIGQVFPAFLPTQGLVDEGHLETRNYVPPSPVGVDWRVGQNPGVAATTTGHPADLDEAINELTDHNDQQVNWMLIDGGSRILMGKLDGSLSQGSSATMSIWMGSTLTDTGDNITVYDWLLGSGESIDSGKKVKAEYYCGKWYVTAAEC